MNYKLMGGTGRSNWGGGGGPSPSKPPSKPPKEKEPEKGGGDLDEYDGGSRDDKDGGKRGPREPSKPGKYVDIKVSVCNTCHYEASDGVVAGMSCSNCGKGKYEIKEIKRLLKDKKWIKSKEDMERQRKARSMYAEDKSDKANRLARQEYIGKKGQNYYKKTGKVPTAEQRKEWEKGFGADFKKIVVKKNVSWRKEYEGYFGKITDKEWGKYLAEKAAKSEIPKTRTWAEHILKMRGKR